MMTQTRKRLPPANPKQAAACCAPLDGLLSHKLFKAFSDPTRVLLFECLAKCGRDCSVSEIAECCSVDFSVVSRHLALLARAGIVEVTKQGRSVFYRVHYSKLSHSLRSIADALDSCCPTKKGGKSASNC